MNSKTPRNNNAINNIEKIKIISNLIMMEEANMLLSHCKISDDGDLYNKSASLYELIKKAKKTNPLFIFRFLFENTSLYIDKKCIECSQSYYQSGYTTTVNKKHSCKYCPLCNKCEICSKYNTSHEFSNLNLIDSAILMDKSSIALLIKCRELIRFLKSAFLTLKKITIKYNSLPNTIDEKSIEEYLFKLNAKEIILNNFHSDKPITWTTIQNNAQSAIELRRNPPGKFKDTQQKDYEHILPDTFLYSEALRKIKETGKKKAGIKDFEGYDQISTCSNEKEKHRDPKSISEAFFLFVYFWIKNNFETNNENNEILVADLTIQYINLQINNQNNITKLQSKKRNKYKNTINNIKSSKLKSIYIERVLDLKIDDKGMNIFFNYDHHFYVNT